MTDCHDFAKQCLAKSSPAIKKALKYLRVYGIILIFASKNPSLHKRWMDFEAYATTRIVTVF